MAPTSGENGREAMQLSTLDASLHPLSNPFLCSLRSPLLSMLVAERSLGGQWVYDEDLEGEIFVPDFKSDYSLEKAKKKKVRFRRSYICCHLYHANYSPSPSLSDHHQGPRQALLFVIHNNNDIFDKFV